MNWIFTKRQMDCLDTETEAHMEGGNM